MTRQQIEFIFFRKNLKQINVSSWQIYGHSEEITSVNISQNKNSLN